MSRRLVLLTVSVKVVLIQQHTHDASLLVNITRNTRRYIQLFAEVIDKIMPEPDHEVDHTTDVLDVIMDSRRTLNEQLQSGDNADPNIFPPELMRR
jgi:DNA replication licensing factor MCM7